MKRIKIIASLVLIALATTANSAEQIYFVHTDHLGAPVTITDDTQAQVWQASEDAFGNGSPIQEDIEFNLRFPGQYYDEETGLHYNWNRYYDPETGRYITSDPIGLGGGLNTYGYVGANPVNSFDIKGLQAGTLGRGLSGGGLGGLGGGSSNGQGGGRDGYGRNAGHPGYGYPSNSSRTNDQSQNCPTEPESEDKHKCRSGEYGPFHRRQGHELGTIDLIEQSNQLWGTARRDSVFPQVQAWKGPLPDHIQGVEFCTPIAPTNESHPSWVSWFAGPGEAKPVPGKYGEWVYIPIRITKINR